MAHGSARTSFVGRSRELDELEELVVRNRLVTIVGVGGAGKTRVAAALADRLACRETVAIVELAPLADERRLPHAIAAALDVEPAAGEVIPSITARLAARPTTVVLDNCEHLLDGVAEIVEHLLAGCPAARILATSREPLRVAGEVSWSIPPLESHDSSDAEAVALFIARARDGRPDFVADEHAVPVIAEVCRRLDGLPLAIELAAARIRTMPLDQLAANLDQRFRLLTGGARRAAPRQQTLQGCLDWSYELLTVDEQAAFRQLSVFRSPFKIEAAERVISKSPVGSTDAVPLVLSLADKSMVLVRDDGRYALLETVRDYASLRLVASGEASDTRDEHLAWAAELVDADHTLTLANWELPNLLAEAEDVRAAFEWALESESLELAVATEARTAALIATAMSTAGNEGREASIAARIASRALERSRPGSGMRTRLLRVLTTSAALDADTSALLDLRRALEAELDAVDEPAERFLVLEVLAANASPFDFDAARRYQREALEVAIAAGDERLAQRSRTQLIGLEAQLGNWRAAEELAAELGRLPQWFRIRLQILTGRLAEAAASVDEPPIDSAQVSAGLWASQLGARAIWLAQAIRLDLLRGLPTTWLEAFDDAMALADRLGHALARINSGWVPGAIALAHDDAEGAVERLEPWRERVERVGMAHPSLPLVIEARLAVHRIDDARSELRRQQAIAPEGSILAGRLVTLDAAVTAAEGRLDDARLLAGQALCTHHEAGWRLEVVDAVERAALLVEDKHERGRIVGAVQALRDAMDYRLRWPSTRKRLDELVHDEAFDRGVSSGRELTENAAVALALDAINTRRLGRRPTDLTTTEQRVEALAARGLTNREIADELVIGVETVKTHLSRIFDKRGVRNRQALRRLVERRE